jgi:hypothetical protein
MKLDREGFRKVLSIKREPLRVCLLTTQTRFYTSPVFYTYIAHEIS